MSEQVTSYKCPNCDGGLKFVGSTGKLECEFCGSVFNTDELKSKYAAKEDAAAKAFSESESGSGGASWDTSELETWDSADGMKSYSCLSCGGQIICEETTAATFCPYCSNPSLIPGQFSDVLRPNYILPFKLDQKAAQKALENHYKGKKLLPDCFVENNRIKEIKGVYVPFWLFDGVATADITFDAENTRSYTRGDYRITETRHYFVRRSGSVPFEKIPVDASEKIPDSYMDAIEPFDYSELREFSSSYLPGFLAHKYDVSTEESAARADLRAVNTAISALSSDVIGYGSCTIKDKRVSLSRSKVHYAWLPVYLLGTVWNGQRYLFAMNGQTGRLIGDLPIDKSKYRKYFWGTAAVVTAVLSILLYLFM